MAKKFKTQEILDMAVGLIDKDMDADLNFDGKISAADAKINLREEKGLPADSSSSSSSSLMAEDIIDSIIEKQGSFSYDMNADPLYQHYSELYKNEGQRNAQDIFGLASSLTGGYGNSYGLTLAGKALSDASAKAVNKGIELEEKAYDRHLDEIEGLYDLLDAANEREDRNADKKKTALDFAMKAADSGDYYYLNQLGIDTSLLSDKDSMDKAQFLAKYGDYSGLSEIGVDLTSLNKKELSEMAQLLAKYGDYSGLSEIGVDLTSLNKKELSEIAELHAKYGDYSLLKLLGIDTSGKETEDYYNRLLLKAKYYNS
ncbi:MAG: hypothetical protein IKL10_06810 [Clostridia bacterium]|nr:hypothetical protein [Clostridia bacterium]